MKESLALKNKGFWVSPCLLLQWRLQQAEFPVDRMLASSGSPQNLPASMLPASTLPCGLPWSAATSQSPAVTPQGLLSAEQL